MLASHALQRLLKDARQAPADASVLSGDEGLTAVIEPSGVGPARLVRVRRADEELYRAFLLHPGEARPAFYPVDLPFASTALCSVTWGAEFGLAVLWTIAPNGPVELPGREQLAALVSTEAPGMEDFVRRFDGASHEDKISMMQGLSDIVPASLLESLKSALGDPFGGGLPAEARALLSDVIAFHQEEGWEVLPGPEGSATSRRWILTRGPRVRRIAAVTMFGMTTVSMSERPST